jgi:hypothetical protein
LALLAAIGTQLGAAAPAGAADELIGTFRVTPGSCSGGASGSYFRMILPTGTTKGPWVDNADSTCGDHTYTLLSPGTDGGLVTGSHQPAPAPGFDANGNSLAVKVIRPVRFFGVSFSASSNPTDLQTQASVPAPTLRADGGALSGDLRSFAATWNDQAFNQGAPKPDGSRPGNTAAPSGTYDAATGKYTLTWTSQIVGGPFDKFTGLWHLEGTFVPAGAAAPSTGDPTATTVAQSGTPTEVTAAPTGDAPVADPAPGGDAPEVAAPATPDATGGVPASAVRVEDEAFEAPVWIVIALALVGIAGVVFLLGIGGRRAGDDLEGTAHPS